MSKQFPRQYLIASMLAIVASVLPPILKGALAAGSLPSSDKKPATYVRYFTGPAGGCEYKYYYDASRFSEQQLKKWIEFSPMSYDSTNILAGVVLPGNPGPAAQTTRIRGSSDQIDTISVSSGDVAAVLAVSPTEMRPLLEGYLREFRFYAELRARRDNAINSGNVALLKQPIEGLTPTSICPRIIQAILNSTSAEERSTLINRDWSNALTHEFYMRTHDQTRNWSRFLRKEQIRQVRLSCSED